MNITIPIIQIEGSQVGSNEDLIEPEYMYIYIHTYIHTCIHSCIHTYINVCI
jgi:hypothetical protein